MSKEADRDHFCPWRLLITYHKKWGSEARYFKRLFCQYVSRSTPTPFLLPACHDPEAPCTGAARNAGHRSRVKPRLELRGFTSTCCHQRSNLQQLGGRDTTVFPDTTQLSLLTWAFRRYFTATTEASCLASTGKAYAFLVRKMLLENNHAVKTL